MTPRAKLSVNRIKNKHLITGEGKKQVLFLGYITGYKELSIHVKTCFVFLLFQIQRRLALNWNNFFGREGM
jgi:hypothetical protein